MRFQLEDLHVHSTYSDGKNTVEENLLVAELRGLTSLGCVDHVRRSSTWLPQFSNHVARIAKDTDVDVFCGVEAKILTVDGQLDLPENLAGVDMILAADHRLPMGPCLWTPAEVKKAVAAGEISERLVVDALVSSYLGVISNYEGVLIAHPFSFLRQAGISEELLTQNQLSSLALASVARGAQWEVSERWRCPSPRTIHALDRRGVRLRISTDSHQASRIGRYAWVHSALQQARNFS